MSRFVNRSRELSLFLIASFVLSFLVFGDALWRRSILAPLDIARSLWTQFDYLEPGSDALPQNQQVVDQIGYDLPLQTLIHEAWRNGEIPWWNPYSHGGRPLLADAHCNGADPLRVAVYLCVPDFVLAYNWTRVLHWIWGSLGVFLVLRWTGARPLYAGLLALAGEVAGWKTQLFGHPWVEGALCWYPWLWLAWEAIRVRRTTANTAAASICVAAIFFAGNIQSHVYLPLFALAVIAGWAGTSASGWWKALKTTAPTAIIGGLLAAPLLLAEWELYHLSLREVTPHGWQIWNIPLAFSSIHPWLLGTARTGSYGAYGVAGFAFALWAGSAMLPLAAMGLRASVGESGKLKGLRRTSIILILGYLVIVATPLHSILYARYAGFPLMGLLILAALGLIRLDSREAPSRWLFRITLLALLFILITGDIFGRFLYPHVREKYAAKLEAKIQVDGYGGRSALLRAAQVEAVPGEISLKNPEVLCGALALAAVALALRSRKTPAIWCSVLILNLIAPVLYARRFIPHQPIEMWERLKAGSAEQRRVLAKTSESHGRLEETTLTSEYRNNPPDGFAGLFPQEMGAIYHVHTLHGYAALIPPNIWWDKLPGKPSRADYVLRPNGELTNGSFHRFQDEATGSPARIVAESLNHLSIVLPNLEGGKLQWNDNAYPGWSAHNSDNGAAIAIAPSNHTSILTVPSGTQRIHLDYRPTGFLPGLALSAFAVVLLIGDAIRSKLRKQMTASRFSV